MATGSGKKILQGVVVSTKNAKTIVVNVERNRIHPIYKKRISFHTKFHAHDEREEGGDGDLVKIISCRPISSKKK